VHIAPDASKMLASCSVTGLPKSLVPRPLVSTTRPALELVSLADGTRTRLATGEDPDGVFPYSLLTEWGRDRVIHADSDHAGVLDFSGTSGFILAAPRPPELAAGAALALSQDGAFLVRFGDPLLAFPLGGGPAITLEVGASQVRFATGGMDLLYLVGATGELVRQGVDGTARTVLVTAPALPGRTALRLAGDGGRVAYALGDPASTCSLVTTERGAAPVSLGACHEAPLFTGDNAHVVWAGAPGPDGKVTTLLVAESANPLATALVTAAAGESLGLVGTVGTGHVLFTRTLPSGSTSLELIPLRAGVAVVLDADIDVNAIRYSVSPDQRQILLMPAPHELVSHDLGSGQFRTLSRQADADTLSAWPWSPRGTYIVFRECSLPGCGGPGDTLTTVLARADSSADARRYPAIPARPLVMDFSPDESKILIQDAGRLFWVDVATGLATEVARFTNRSGPALWLDSNRFLFTDVAGLPGIYLSSACR
jgi:hypothetical protein